MTGLVAEVYDTGAPETEMQKRLPPPRTTVRQAQARTRKANRSKDEKRTQQRKRRSSYHKGSTFELECARAIGGYKDGRRGQIDVGMYDPMGESLLAGECIHSKEAKVPRWIQDKYDEAIRLGGGRRVPLVFSKERAGQGRITEPWVHMKRADFAVLIEHYESIIEELQREAER